MTTPPSILVVEDEAVIALDLQLQLQDMGYRVIGPAASGAEALALAGRERPDLALMDIRIQGTMDGIETATRLAAGSNMAVVFLSAHDDAATVARARPTLRCSFVSKPFATATLQAAIAEALLRELPAACREAGCI